MALVSATNRTIHAFFCATQKRWQPSSWGGVLLKLLSSAGDSSVVPRLFAVFIYEYACACVCVRMSDYRLSMYTVDHFSCMMIHGQCRIFSGVLRNSLVWILSKKKAKLSVLDPSFRGTGGVIDRDIILPHYLAI